MAPKLIFVILIFITIGFVSHVTGQSTIVESCKESSSWTGMQAHKAEWDELRADLMKYKDDTRKIIAKLGDEVTGLSDINDALNSENANITSQVNVLRETIEELNLENKKLKEKVDNMTDDYDKLGETLETLTNTNTELHDNLANLTGHIDDLKKENIVLSGHISTMAEENSEQNTQISDMKTNMTNVTDTMATHLKKINNDLNAEINSLKSENDDLKGSIKALAVINDELSDKVIALVENITTISGNVTEIETTNMKRDVQVNKLGENIATLLARNSELNATMETIETKNTEMKTTITNLASKQVTFTNQMENLVSTSYTRWGRKECPANATVLYTGMTGGSHYRQSGGGADFQCLPLHPEWGKFFNGSSRYSARMYGVEYEVGSHQKSNPFLSINAPNSNANLLDNREVPCTVCEVNRSETLMIPARWTCPAGWTFEYQGYLMADYSGGKRTSWICVDEAPEALTSRSANDNHGGMYAVEVGCGSLQCTPDTYVSGFELTCVVCTK